MSIIARKKPSRLREFSEKIFPKIRKKNRGKFTPPHNLLFNLTKILALIVKKQLTRHILYVTIMAI